jgi:NRAMP (natural resistance-associated macrophage protein)-like metal ion transporter
MNFIKKISNFWKTLGPGITTGAADDDPSGIATYSQTGAKYGFNFLWMAPLTFPLMAIVQEMCARIGLVTGMGLAGNIKKHYSKTAIYICAFLLFFANVFNIGADLGAMAEVTRLVFPKFNFSILVIFFAFVSLSLQIFISYKNYSKYLKYLTFSLFAYIIVVFFVEVDWLSVLQSLISPKITLNKESIFIMCAILGTTISPYLFFWQTSQEVEEYDLSPRELVQAKGDLALKYEIKNMRTDVWTGMFFSNIVMFFIIVTCAVTLFDNGVFNINTAAEAASALRPFAGDFTYVLFALGIIGTGFLAIPVLAGSVSYAFSEAFDWKMGLNKNWREAWAFYGIIALAVILGILLNFVGLDPIKALIYSSVFNGMVAPVMIYFILRLSSSEYVMGDFKSRKVYNILGWSVFVLMTLVGIATLFVLFT